MSTINYTYNVIVDRFRQFADGHFQLRRFTHGEISQADLEKEAEWPWMHVKPRAINYSPGTRAFSFEIFISDLPRDKEDKTGYQAESITDCSLIFQDLINEIHLGQMFGDDVVLTRPVNSEPFVEQYTHTLTGVTGIIELSLDYDWSACSIPASWNYNTPTNSPNDGFGALQFIESLHQDGVFVSLDNDLEAPGNSYYYGTNASGVKGWYAIVDNIGLTCETLPDCPVIIGITEDIVYLLDTIALKANTADLGATAFSNDYGDLDNLPTIPAAQVNSDWNATSGVAEILNKPTIPTSLPPSGAAGGDLTGTYPNPTVHRVHGVDFQSGAPAVDDTWIYVSTPLGPQPFQWQHSKLKTSQVQNDSTVTGTNADDALEHLDSSKQATLVSGTNIKTVNSNSLLGSGNLSVGTFNLPTLTSGSVLFSNGTTIAQDNANLFWDDTNNRLGIGTASPTSKLSVLDETLAEIQSAVYSNVALNAGSVLVRKSRGTIASPSAILSGDRLGGFFFSGNNTGSAFYNGCALIGYANENFTASAGGSYFAFETTSNGTTSRTEKMRLFGSGNLAIGTTTDAGFKLDVNGSVRATGSISAASAIARGTFLSQTLVATANSDALVGLDINPTFTVGAFSGVQQEHLVIRGGNNPIIKFKNAAGATTWGQFGANASEVFFNAQGGALSFVAGNTQAFYVFSSTRNVTIQNGGTYTDIASSQLSVNSTTRGFLPPRMTTTQKNAIATPAAGLVVYDTTLGKLCVRGAAAWETITSV